MHADQKLLHLLDSRRRSGIGSALHAIYRSSHPSFAGDGARHPRGLELARVVGEAPRRRAVLPQQGNDAAVDGLGLVKFRPAQIVVCALSLLLRCRLADVEIDRVGIGDHVEVVLVMPSHLGESDPGGGSDLDELVESHQLGHGCPPVRR